MTSPQVKRALISVSDKMGLADFARGLCDNGVEIYSTGGTRRHLEESGLEVRDVAEYTGFPEMMDGRVKTLHPKIFAGILCRHDRNDDMQALSDHEIQSFELVVVNLYPFESTIARDGVTVAEAIEQIDIGGPSLVRAAAKNHAHTTISTSPEQYAEILDEIAANKTTSPEFRRRLAGQAFTRTAAYDRAISAYFAGLEDETEHPSIVSLGLQLKSELRYGENPHQPAAVYAQPGVASANLVAARQLNGKELSYNNYLDLDSALAMVRDFVQPACVVLKHTNPCGAATADSLRDACEKAMAGDPVSAFGSVLGFNRPVDAATAELLATPGLFVEAIVAPEFDGDAVEILTTKPKWKSNVRLMQVGSLDAPAANRHVRHIDGGLLIQHADIGADNTDDWTIPTQAKPDSSLQAELEFGWAMVRHVKSNAIVLSKNCSLVGVGAGQMSRVDSVEISIKKAGERAQGSVLSSDAFFPFPDSIHAASEAGIRAIIQPGGSRRDQEVIDACD